MKRISKKEALAELAIRIIQSNAHNDKNDELHYLAVHLSYLLSQILLEKNIRRDDIDDVLRYFNGYRNNMFK